MVTSVGERSGGTEEAREEVEGGVGVLGGMARHGADRGSRWCFVLTSESLGEWKRYGDT